MGYRTRKLLRVCETVAMRLNKVTKTGLALLAGLFIYAAIDGGTEPTRLIRQPVALPAAAQ